MNTTTTVVSYESLAVRINTIAKAERITKSELSLLSREMLAFVIDTKDVRPFNELLGKGEDGKYNLTALNRKMCSFFLREFTPFSDNGANIDKGEQLTFVKLKAKAWDKYVAKIEDFLSVETNDVWTWAQENIKLEQKPVNYMAKLEKDVEKALNDEVNGISKADVLIAVMKGGISVDDLMLVVEQMSQAVAA